MTHPYVQGGLPRAPRCGLHVDPLEAVLPLFHTCGHSVRCDRVYGLPGSGGRSQQGCTGDEDRVEDLMRLNPYPALNLVDPDFSSILFNSAACSSAGSRKHVRSVALANASRCLMTSETTIPTCSNGAEEIGARQARLASSPQQYDKHPLIDILFASHRRQGAFWIRTYRHRKVERLDNPVHWEVDVPVTPPGESCATSSERGRTDSKIEIRWCRNHSRLKC